MDHLLKSKDKYICRYPEKDLVQILKDLAYYSEEWKETDPDEYNNNEENEEAKTSIVIYEKWWRSPAVCIFIIYLIISFIYQKYDGNSNYLSFSVYYTSVWTQWLNH